MSVFRHLYLTFTFDNLLFFQLSNILRKILSPFIPHFFGIFCKEIKKFSYQTALKLSKSHKT